MNWFQRPYPLIEKLQSKLYVVIGFGVFVPTFLYTYQPFGIGIIDEKFRLWYTLGIGAHIALVLFINYVVLPRIFKKIFNPEKWTISKEIIFILWSFFLATCSNYLYNTTVGTDISPHKSFVDFLGVTVAVGIFPVIIMVFLVEKNLSSRNVSRASEYTRALLKSKRTDKEGIPLKIDSESVKSESLEIHLTDFIFASSDNNYSTLFYRQGETLEKKLLRLSFKNLENQLSKYDNVVRCHKSYMVNKDHIVSIRGNARSLMLEVLLFEGMIPVSRSFPKERLT